jgi:hypothetical protein
MGKGAVYSTSTRHKLVTRSSTESELVGIHDVMPDILWTKNFLEAQGVIVTDNVLYQDNQSCILLERNGRQSSTKRTKHINVRYFFVKDKIASGDVVLRYCQTENMHADFFTKVLRGSLFRKHRDFIMNVDPAFYDADHRSGSDGESDGETGKRKSNDYVPTPGQTESDDVDDPTPYRTALLKRLQTETDRVDEK